MDKQTLLQMARQHNQNPVYDNYTNPHQIMEWLEKVEHELTESEDDEVREWAASCFEM